MKILIADDQELVREAIAAFLRMEPDFTVDATSDFPSAVEAVKRNGTYDLVLLDYMMPGMNGLSGLAAMKKLQEGKPVAILSGTAPRAVAEQALGEGAAGFLPKTMSTRSLIAAERLMAGVGGSQTALSRPCQQGNRSRTRPARADHKVARQDPLPQDRCKEPDARGNDCKRKWSVLTSIRKDRC